MGTPVQKVIIVEEDPVEAGILEFYLDRAGLEAVTVMTTAEALDHVDPATPYAVLTEAHGAQIDWQELAHATLGYPSIFMVLSDEAPTKEDEFTAMRYGVAEIYVKPVDPKTVVERVRLQRAIPLGSGSVGIPEDGFGGDFCDHHAQKLLGYCRRHRVNALLEIEHVAEFGGILFKDGHPIDAWIEGLRGRTALNAILMLEEAPFVLFALGPDADELKRPNVIGTDVSIHNVEPDPTPEGPAPPESHYDQAGEPALPPPVPPTKPPKKKKRRRFSKTGDTDVQSVVTQGEKLAEFGDTVVEEPDLNALKRRPARPEQEVVALSPTDTVITAPPPVPAPKDPGPAAPPVRPRRETMEEVAIATVAHVQFDEVAPVAKEDVDLPIMDPEEHFFDEEAEEPEAPEEDLEDWELGIKTGPKWSENPTVVKALLAALILLVVFVGYRIATAPPADEAAQDASEVVEKATVEPTGLQLIAKGDTDKARSVLRNALVADPSDADGLAGLGIIAFSSGDWKAAKDFFGRLLEVKPGAIRAQWYLSVASQALGDPKAAKEHGELYLEASPTGKEADALREALGL